MSGIAPMACCWSRMVCRSPKPPMPLAVPRTVCAAGANATSRRAGTAWRTGPGLGRPSKLDAAAHDLLEAALARSPLDYDYPVTIWTVADLTDLLSRQGWSVSTATVYRTLEAMGYRYRRPRHDLTHR
jgi:transposase